MNKPTLLLTLPALAALSLPASAALTSGLAYSAYNLFDRVDQTRMYSFVPSAVTTADETAWANVSAAHGAYASDFGDDNVGFGAEVVWNRVVAGAQTGTANDVHLIYRGFFYDSDGAFAFAENIDDNVHVRIDGVAIMKNDQATQGGSWSTPTTSLSNAEPGGGTANGNTAWAGLSGAQQVGNFGIGWHSIEIVLGEFGGTGGPHNNGGNNWSDTFGFGIAGIGNGALPTGAARWDRNSYVAFDAANFPLAPDGGPGLRYDNIDVTGGTNIVIPEPASMGLLGLSLAALLRRRR